uniref:Uncharacterized protein n=1 Tax=Tanacetum cinerariifolium TaxID=118510 RepID=A0A6L2N544_TANCI|nr:hypothetical protein [Tanacetum cinerariifolium]
MPATPSPATVCIEKAAKKHDTLALVAHTSSSSTRSTPPYYVTHPPSMVDYDDDYQGDTFQNDPKDTLTSVMMLLARAITQPQMLEMMVELLEDHTTLKKSMPRISLFRKRLGMFKEIFELLHQEIIQMFGATIIVQKDEAKVILSNEQNDFLIADVAQIEEIKELSTKICMMVRIQPTNIDFNEGPSYDSTLTGHVKTPLTSFMDSLFSNSDHEQTCHEQPEMINFTTGSDQINSNIIFDDPNVEVNDGIIEHDKNAHDSFDNELEQLTRNAYKEAEKQQILTQKVKQPNVELTKLKKNEIVVIKLSNSVQALFMLGPKPLSVYDPQLKHGLGDLDATTQQNEILNDRLLKATLKHDAEKCVLMCSDSMNDDLTAEIEKVRRESIDARENFHKRIEILEYDVQRCQNQKS